jgi:tetratricopeptide (TPR) repeat protein
MGALRAEEPANRVHSLTNLILIRRRAGTIAPPVAERSLRTVLAQAIRVRYPELAAEVRAELGDVLRQLGRYDEATAELERALEMFDQSDELRFRARAMNTLGNVRREAGDPEAAADLHRRASELARTVSQPTEVARAHLGLGDCAGDPGVAREHWRTAEEIFTRLQVPERFEAASRL